MADICLEEALKLKAEQIRRDNEGNDEELVAMILEGLVATPPYSALSPSVKESVIHPAR